MKKIITSIVLFLATSNMLLAQFTPGNLVVYQVGDGSAALASSGTATFLKEYATSGGAPTFSMSVPTTGGGRLVNSGTATSEGLITRSVNGHYIVIAGYDAATGTTGLTGSSSATVNRVIDTIDATGLIGKAVLTNTFYSANNIRSVASDGSNNYWAGGPTSGTTYMGTGTAAQLISPAINTRAINIFNNQLYYSTGSGTTGIYKIGTGTPMTSGQTAALTFSTTSSPYGFAFNATGDTCYVADDAAGITKYVYNGTSWSAAYVLTTTTARGIVVNFSVNPHVVYATTAAGSSGNTIIKISDVGAASPATVIATAPTNTVFRGIAFSPICQAVAISSVTNATPACSNSLGLNVSTLGSAPLSYTWSGAGTFSSTSVKTPTITSGAATGIYSVTVANGCGVATSTVSVTVNTAPTLTANTTNTAVCTGNQITLTGSGASTYTWTGGATDGVAFTPTVASTYTVTGTDVNGCKNSAAVTVTVNPLPTVSVNTATICIGNTATLTAGGAISYTWNTTETTTSINPSPTTNANYTVTGTDANGCVNKSTSTVTVNNLPTISFTGRTTLCVWDVDTLTAHGAISYTWSPFNSFTTQVIGGPTTPGNVTFTLTGTDANGCTNSLTQLVTVNAQPNISAIATSSAVCVGNQTTLSGSGANTYTWSNGISDGVAFTPTATATYTVIGTDVNNCKDTTTINIVVNNLPTISINTATICAGATATLTATGATSYTWNTTEITTSINPSPTTNANYTVTGTDANNCVNTAMTTVTVNSLPVVVANASSTSICIGDAETLTGSGAQTYTWTGSVVDGTPFSPSSSDTYTVMGTDINGCINSDNISITVNSLPNITATTSSNTICVGDNTTLFGHGASTYTWSTSVNNGVAFTPSATDTYTVSGTNGTGCTNTTTITITVNNLPNVQANTTATAVCLGQQITLTGSGAASYTWSGVVVDGNAFTPSSTDSYTVTGTDGNNCVNTATISVTVNLLPVVVANTTASVVCMGSSVTLTGSGASTYTWTNGVIDGSAFSPSSSNTYTVMGTDANGCINSDTIGVIVNNCSTGILSVNQAEIKIYPNPSNGEFAVTGLSEGSTVEIFNELGMNITNFKENNGVVPVSILNMNNGIYLLRVFAKDGSFISQHKIIKQQ